MIAAAGPKPHDAQWDAQIGYHHPHTLNEADPIRKRMAEERMKHPPVRFTNEMINAITQSLSDCIKKSNGGLIITALAIEPTHLHALLPYTGKDIDATAKWIADQTTKAVHRTTRHQGPVWAKGCWRSFIYEDGIWQRVDTYINNHNTREGRKNPL